MYKKFSWKIKVSVKKNTNYLIIIKKLVNTYYISIKDSIQMATVKNFINACNNFKTQRKTCQQSFANYVNKIKNLSKDKSIIGDPLDINEIHKYENNLDNKYISFEKNFKICREMPNILKQFPNIMINNI